MPQHVIDAGAKRAELNDKAGHDTGVSTIWLLAIRFFCPWLNDAWLLLLLRAFVEAGTKPLLISVIQLTNGIRKSWISRRQLAYATAFVSRIPTYWNFIRIAVKTFWKKRREQQKFQASFQKYKPVCGIPKAIRSIGQLVSVKVLNDVDWRRFRCLCDGRHCSPHDLWPLSRCVNRIYAVKELLNVLWPCVIQQRWPIIGCLSNFSFLNVVAH